MSHQIISTFGWSIVHFPLARRSDWPPGSGIARVFATSQLRSSLPGSRVRIGRMHPCLHCDILPHAASEANDYEFRGK